MRYSVYINVVCSVGDNDKANECELSMRGARARGGDREKKMNVCVNEKVTRWTLVLSILFLVVFERCVV